jgi:hypothetical protein
VIGNHVRRVGITPFVAAGTRLPARERQKGASRRAIVGRELKVAVDRDSEAHRLAAVDPADPDPALPSPRLSSFRL